MFEYGFRLVITSVLTYSSCLINVALRVNFVVMSHIELDALIVQKFTKIDKMTAFPYFQKKFFAAGSSVPFAYMIGTSATVSGCINNLQVVLKILIIGYIEMVTYFLQSTFRFIQQVFVFKYRGILIDTEEIEVSTAILIKRGRVIVGPFIIFH